MVDLSSHNTNPPGVFDGAPYKLRDSSDDRDGEALASIRAFVEEFGVHPTAEAWTATGMTPSEKTIRRRFGSFRSAVARANGPPPPAAPKVPIPYVTDHLAMARLSRATYGIPGLNGLISAAE